MIIKIFFCCFLFFIQSFPQTYFANKFYPAIADGFNQNTKIKFDEINSLKPLDEFNRTDLFANIFKLDSVNFKEDSVFSNNTEPLPEWYSMITNLPSDWFTYYKQEFTTDNIPKYLGLAALTAGLIVTDEKTWRESERFYHRTTFNKNFSELFTEIGDGRTQFGIAAAFAAYGFIAKDNRAIRTASQTVEAVLAAGAVVQVIKHLTGRESPFVETKSGGAWRFFPNQIDYHKHVAAYDAFPSGHIATSMAAFIVVSENYPEVKWLEPASFALAGLIGFGMANKGIHWYSDYPLGIAFGYIFGKIIAHPSYLIKTNDLNKKASATILPYFNGSSKGLSFAYQL
jgi:membrane-associated phospholipid phosphatase